MSTRTTLLLCAALSLSTLACGKKDESGASSSGGAASERMAPAKAVTLTELDNLKVDIAEGTEPSKMGGDLMIISMDESFNVGPAGPGTPATLDDAKKAAEADKGTNVKTETLKDGWLITYEAEGSLGTSYFLKVRRTIGGKDYSCGTSVGHKKLRDGATAACKSLRP